ncbi:MAG: bifunctional oligoribonuclease/PAP phosphatase NrnA [Bacteroidota bacterium]|nr:bifunctional oligoribonuclease/PAP phosphatase NrnA [Bacteroidota bacterium]MDE2834042.1 bifunctional oligoribonuclease/PAP phosphatase NrnA [Bacteroidota bacterium]
MLRDVLEVLRGYDRFLIVTHMRPDGDAIGSQLALGMVLRQLGKQVVMMNSDPVPPDLDWMPGVEDIRQFDGLAAQIYAVANAQVIVVVDTNALNRLGPGMSNQVANSQAKMVLIDHHTEPETWFDVSCVHEQAAATGQIIYDLIGTLDENLIRADVATALYTALTTDTGSYRFSTVTAEVHRIAADLLSRGSMAADEVYRNVYQSRSPTWPRLVSRVLDTFTLLHGGQLAYLQLLQRMFKDTDTRYDDAEGMIEWAMAVDGVQVALMFTETKRGIKVSFRSKGEFAVDVWARELGGGGHPNAAGAYFRMPLDEVTGRVLALAAKHMESEFTESGFILSAEDKAYLSALTSLQK